MLAGLFSGCGNEVSSPKPPKPMQARRTPASAPVSLPATVPNLSLAPHGRRLYAALRCDACHGPDREEEAPGLPPSLSLAGSKLRPEWIKSYLNDPTPIRFASDRRRPIIRMPRYRLTARETDALVAYLSTLVDETRFGTPVDRELLASADPADGRRLFQEYQCLGCHTLGSEGNKIGPDLTHVGRRLRPKYILGFVRDPPGVIPGTPMKDIALWDEEAAAVAAFLAEQR